MPRFTPLLDLPLMILAVVATIAGTLYWVYQTDQDDVPKNSETASRVMFRISVIATVIGSFCCLTGIAFWFFAIDATVVLFSAITSLLGIGGLPILAMVVLVQEYVLGFPGLILSPKDRSVPTGNEPPPSPMVGRDVITSAPLRPQGEILIDGQTFPASSDSGRMIDAGVPVRVTGTKNGNLIVAEIENAG